MPCIKFLEITGILREEIKNYYRLNNAHTEDSSIEEFLDESISLPTELDCSFENESTADDEEGNQNLAGKISCEMILSGMIKTIASPTEYGVEPNRIAYYRNLVLALKPEIFNELCTAAVVKTRNGDFDMALEILVLLEGLFPGNPLILLNMALVLEEKSDSYKDSKDGAKFELQKKALNFFEALLAMESAPPEVFLNAGYFFLRRKEYGRVRECFSEYLSLTDNDSDNADKRKKVFTILKDLEKKGLDDSDFLEAFEKVGSGNAAEGLPFIRKFLEKHPKVWNGWFVLGWALRVLGRWQDSLEAFRKTIEFGGGNSDTHNEMAICFMESGDLPAAEKELETALKNDPENTKIISNLGVVALKTGNKELAAAYFRTVLELDPDDVIAKNFIEDH